MSKGINTDRFAMSLSQVARELKISENAAYKAFASGMRKLREGKNLDLLEDLLYD